MTEPARVPLWALVVTPASMVAAFFLGTWVARRTPLPEPQRTALEVVHQEILRSYVEEQDPAQLLERAITAMAGLDDYSQYVPPRDVPNFVEGMTGKYEGIGVIADYTDDGVFVSYPLADGPADRAGLQPGDRIVAIDDTDLTSMPREESSRMALDHLRGTAGSQVRLRLQRGAETLSITVERGPVQRQSAKWEQLLDEGAGLGYLHLSDFHPGSADACARALDRLAASAGALRGLVLDLRFDGGGNLDECVALARMFLAKGNIVSMRRRGSELLESIDADGTCAWPDLPLVLLVNYDTASASEVLAGALQDQHRAAVVGAETYGKGVVNTLFEWRNLAFRLKLTTAHYYTPNGRNLERDRRRRQNGQAGGPGAAAPLPPGGITPDRIVPVDERGNAAIQRALAGQPFAERHREALQRWCASSHQRLPGILPPAEDPQLAAALAILRERTAAAGSGTDHGAATGSAHQERGR